MALKLTKGKKWFSELNGKERWQRRDVAIPLYYVIPYVCEYLILDTFLATSWHCNTATTMNHNQHLYRSKGSLWAGSPPNLGVAVKVVGYLPICGICSTLIDFHNIYSCVGSGQKRAQFAMPNFHTSGWWTPLIIQAKHSCTCLMAHEVYGLAPYWHVIDDVVNIMPVIFYFPELFLVTISGWVYATV